MKLLFLLIPILTFSQEKIAKGFIFDKVTKEPIPYVNISILDSQKGTSSNEDGSYALYINEKDVHKKVHLSSLGYKDTILTTSSIIKLKTIFLKPIAEELDEVVITEKFEEEFLEVKPFQESELYGGFGAGTRPWHLGLFFPYDSVYNNTIYLRKVTVKLNRGIGYKRKASKFRLRLFSISKDSLPCEDILKESIVITASKKQKEIIADLSRYDIVFPSDGMFVVLEGLAIPFNEIERTYTMVDIHGKKSKIKKEIAYLPSFKAFLSEPNKFLVVHYGNGKWWNYSIPQQEKKKQFVPAISLTLSN